MKSLQRIILIDSYMQGIVELKLNEHTNICGTNASGKTTLQRLVLVFYGELPSNAVPKTRDSFEKWYLPRSTSYIIFEYFNHKNEINQVCLSSSLDGRSVNYRFIGKEYALEDYVKRQSGNAFEFLSMAELGRRFNSQRIDCSNQMSPMEYRAIIQNDQSLSRSFARHKEIRTCTRQYSLCDSRHTLRHIEKLVRAIHTKNGKMASIKTMVAAILEEDGIETPSIKIKPEAVQFWADQTLMVESLIARQEEMYRLNQLDHEVREIEAQLRTDHHWFNRALNDCQNEIKRQTIEKNKLEEKANQAHSHWGHTSRELSGQITVCDSKINEGNRELEQIENRYTVYLNSGIENIQRNLEHLSVWQATKQEYEKQYELLTEEHKGIEEKYQQRRTEIIENQSARSEKEHKLLRSLEVERKQRVDSQNRKIRQEEDKQTQKLTAAQEEYHHRNTQLASNISAFKAQLQYMGRSEEEIEEINKLDQQLEDIEDEVKKLRADNRAADNNAKQAKQIQSEQDQVYQETCKRVNEAEELKEKAIKLRYPDNGSLLHFLRSEKANWTQTLGKVIDSSLLSRRDLKPTLDDSDENSFYGVGLDLNNLEDPEHSQSDRMLAEKVSQVEEQLRLEMVSKESASQSLAKANAQVTETAQLQLSVQSKIHSLEKKFDSLKNEKSIVEQKHREALERRRSIVQQQIIEVEKSITVLDAEKDQTLTELKSTFSEYLLELKGAHEDIIREIEDKITDSEERLDEIKRTANKHLKAAEEAYNNALSEKGIDEKTIAECKQSLEALTEDIDNTINKRQEVYEYQDWKASHIEKRKPELLKQVVDEKEKLTALNKALSNEKNQYKNKSSELERERQRVSTNIGKLHNNKKEAERILQSIENDLTVSGSEDSEGLKNEAQPINPLNLDRQIGRIEQNLSDLSTKKKKLIGEINQFDSLINKSGTSKISESWEKIRVTSMEQSGSLNYHELVKGLEQIFNNLLPQLATSLLGEGRNYSAAIKGYFDILKDIHHKISQQSSRITRHIEEDLDLDGVSDSSVKIKSSISELEYWNDLNHFMELFEKWRDTGYAQQPESDYIDSIKSIVGILSRNTAKLSIINLLDIEIRLKEGNSQLVIRTDQEMADSSSQGMAYLILCKFLLAFTRMIRGSSQQTVHWPVDELGTLSLPNIEKLFQACQRNNIIIFGALPNSELNVLKLFSNRYMIDPKTKVLSTMRPQQSRLTKRLEKLKANQEQQEIVA